MSNPRRFERTVPRSAWRDFWSRGTPGFVRVHLKRALKSEFALAAAVMAFIGIGADRLATVGFMSQLAAEITAQSALLALIGYSLFRRYGIRSWSSLISAFALFILVALMWEAHR